MEPRVTDISTLISTAPISDQTRDFLAASKAARTVRAYRSDLLHFEAWCEDRACQSLPAAPETVADYIAALAEMGMKPATITRRLSAISQAHRMAGLESPTQTQLVRMTAAGIRRTLGTAPRQARPILLLLIGFAGGMRRSELVGLDVDDVVEEKEGLRVAIRRSRTDQQGAGREIGIVRGRNPVTDPVAAVAEWREAAGIADGPLFREVDRGDRVGSERLSDRAVARIVKGAAERVGIDPSTVSGHCLRSGLATSAAAAGAPERSIMRTTGRRSEAMVRRYIRAGSVFTDTASRYLAGL
jgi:site-specific recombinase XerD